MTQISSRAYVGADDLQIMMDLLLVARRGDWIGDYPGQTDLRELLSLEQVRANTRLWFGSVGQPVGWALVDQYNNLAFEFLPGMLKPAVLREVGEWGEECLRRGSQTEPSTLDSSCRGEDHDRIALLEQLGFEQQSLRSLHYARPLTDELPVPRLPDGFQIRAVRGEQEVRALVALHRVAFGTDNMTIEERLAIMGASDYDRALDLVAVSPYGELAGYCICTISWQENLKRGRNEGSTDPIAVHPRFQGMGLAKALLLTGMQLLKERGIERAVLGTSSENLKMQHAAEALGFRLESTRLWFSN